MPLLLIFPSTDVFNNIDAERISYLKVFSHSRDANSSWIEFFCKIFAKWNIVKTIFNEIERYAKPRKRYITIYHVNQRENENIYIFGNENYYYKEFHNLDRYSPFFPALFKQN